MIIAVALAVVALSCSRKVAPPPPRGPVSLASLRSFGNEIYSLANGDAYLINQYDDQLFYLREGAAVRVRDVELSGREPTIYPLANGAAYLVSSGHSKLLMYYLVADRAVEVKEADPRQLSRSPMTQSQEGFLWAQAQATNSRYQRYKRKVEDEQPGDEPERDDY
ncbi:MAG: hypothetical protein ABI779_23830 [Acidobacteriota bacterium]